VMKAACDLNEESAKKLADTWGWQSVETSLDDLAARDDIDLIDIAAPNNVHHLLVMKAIEAGKHVSCEKPLALDVAQAREMYLAAKEAGVMNMIWHNYRRTPALALAKRMIDNGLLGRIYHVRAVYMQDWCMDPDFPLAWRFRKEVAGSGAHGYLNAHLIDAARYLVGEFDSVCATFETFVKERSVELEGGSLFAGKTSDKKEPVTVDDAVISLARFKNGALGTFEATRFAAGHKNGNQIEINGSKGSISFDFERMNELKYYNIDDPEDLLGFRTIPATLPTHPYMEAYWPPGHTIGYEHTFVSAAADFAKAFAEGTPIKPDFEEGLRNQIVLEAMSESGEKNGWVQVPDIS
ncbi:MAG: Gfo/Idh/MocA family oxidoreductase, partial [Planctomycetes bacterium]|nr:Gfo/Idh/MocA family oxidoreductase [Planctomycetota bacterium]